MSTQPEPSSPLLNLIISISQSPFDSSLENEIRALPFEVQISLLPTIGLAYMNIQSLYRFMEDNITAERRNKEDALRPVALSDILTDMPFLGPLCMQVNMRDMIDAYCVVTSGEHEEVGDGEIEGSSLIENSAVWSGLPFADVDTETLVALNKGIETSQELSTADESDAELRTPPSENSEISIPEYLFELEMSAPAENSS